MSRTWHIGATRVTLLRESLNPVPPSGFYGDGFDASLLTRHGAWLRPDYVDDAGDLVVSVQAFVVESRGETVLVDTCIGEHRLPGYDLLGHAPSQFVAELEAAGVGLDDVDHVLCTHLHFDHVGWNTTLVDGELLPTFPRARYLFARTEYAHARAGRNRSTFASTVEPVMDAGVADLVETDHRLTAEVAMLPTPGHTPGHVAVTISSGGERAVITGDLVHHPVQCAAPDMLMTSDVDPRQAAATRRSFLAAHADTDTLVLGTHFAGSACGHVTRHESAWSFGPSSGTTREH